MVSWLIDFWNYSVVGTSELISWIHLFPWLNSSKFLHIKCELLALQDRRQCLNQFRCTAHLYTELVHIPVSHHSLLQRTSQCSVVLAVVNKHLACNFYRYRFLDRVYYVLLSSQKQAQPQPVSFVLRISFWADDNWRYLNSRISRLMQYTLSTGLFTRFVAW